MEEWRAWDKNFWANIGLIEILRFGCASLLLLTLGVVLGVYFQSLFLIISPIAILFFFIVLGLRWRFAYRINRKILGNKNLPEEPMPTMPRLKIAGPRWKRPWYAYLPGIWFLLLDLVILYIFLHGHGK